MASDPGPTPRVVDPPTSTLAYVAHASAQLRGFLSVSSSAWFVPDYSPADAQAEALNLIHLAVQVAVECGVEDFAVVTPPQPTIPPRL